MGSQELYIGAEGALPRSKDSGTHPLHGYMDPSASQFLAFFADMNERAIESMNKDEPETSLEFLKKVDDTLYKL